MVRQTFLNPPTRAACPPPDGPTNGDGSFGDDLAALAALQTRLAAADAREALARAAVPACGLALALLLAVAAAVALVAGLALGIAARYDLGVPAALALAGLGALALAVPTAVVSARSLAASASPFRRSAEELERNAAWIKTTLSRNGR